MRDVIFIAGPTASGKSALALELARRFDGEIVNADSQQVYRGLDIGTAKPTAEERALVPHHLYDVADPWEQWDAARFISVADAAIADIHGRGRRAILVGGTGLWLRALRRGLVEAPARNDEIRARLDAEAKASGWPALHARLAKVDPESAARIHATDPVRIVRALEVFELSGVALSELHRRHESQPPRLVADLIAIDIPMETLTRRLVQRVDRMFEEGLEAETRRMAADPRAREKMARVMGYRETLELIEGRIRPNFARSLIVKAQRQYAKRQFTWFRGEADWSWVRYDRALDEALGHLGGG